MNLFPDPIDRLILEKKSREELLDIAAAAHRFILQVEELTRIGWNPRFTNIVELGEAVKKRIEA
jgi:hypothetical protein